MFGRYYFVEYESDIMKGWRVFKLKSFENIADRIITFVDELEANGYKDIYIKTVRKI